LMIDVIFFIPTLIGALFAWVIVSTRRSIGYIFCNATISAWEARLLSEARLMELAEAPGVVNIFSALEDTEYRPQLADIAKDGEVDLIAVERALRESLNARYRELVEMVPKERKGTVLRVLQRVDLWNLKAIITMIHNKVPKEQRLQELMPSPTMSSERLEMLASAEDLNGLLDFLRGSEQFDVISAALGDYEKRGLIALLSALDKHYYTSLWKDVQAKRAQRSILRAMVGYEIDSVNIKLILRLKREGAPPDEIDKYLVRPSHELTDAMLKAMITAEDIRSAIQMIQTIAHGKVLVEALPQIEEKGIPAAEKALDEAYLKLCRWFGLTQFFSIAPVISFIHIKENEMRNLRAIIRLKADGVEPQKIKERITRVPKIEL
jgi:V/A-type H+-transporting ATPase subunit C